MERSIRGEIASPSYAIGPLFLLGEDRAEWTQHIDSSQIENETQRFHAAHAELMRRFSENIAESKQTNSTLRVELLEGHRMLLSDEDFIESIISAIKNRCSSAEQATHEYAEVFAAEMSELDQYFRERADDVNDISRQLINLLLNRDQSRAIEIEQPSIVVAAELFPSTTLRLDLSRVLGFVTERGGATSHVAFVAKSAGLPALVGAKNCCQLASEASSAIIDAVEGQVIFSPEKPTIEHYRLLLDEYRKQRDMLKATAKVPAVTNDGEVISISSNIGSHQETKAAIENGAEGVGLFRTEFFFMREQEPTEEEQYEAYYAVAKAFAPAPVYIRSLDIGGDKFIPYLNLPVEQNPFLGQRALRLYVRCKRLINVQLRAILRATTCDNIGIMLPMAISPNEIVQFRARVAGIAEQLAMEKKAVGKYKIGAMLETPSSILLCDQFAKHADFLSLGTNDLTQYILAVDRGNEAIAHLYDPMHPALIQAFKLAISSARRYNVPLSLCGALGSDEKAVSKLIGLGLRRFSLASDRIPAIKQAIRECRANAVPDQSDRDDGDRELIWSNDRK